MNWFRRALSLRSRCALPQRLVAYPSYALPYPDIDGHPPNATQAKANLHHLQRNLPYRLRCISTLLRQFDIDAQEALQSKDPRRLLNVLHQWSNQCWPSVFSRRLARESNWRASGHVVHALLTDIGILLGELIIRHHPEFHWAVDDDPSRRYCASYLRIVVQRHPAEGQPIEHHDVADVMAWAFHRYWEIGCPGALSLNSRWKAEVLIRVTLPAYRASVAPPLAKLRHKLCPPPLSGHELGLFDHAIAHLETIESLGLNWERAAHPAWFFLRWLIERDLLAKSLPKHVQHTVVSFQRRQATIADVYASMQWTLKRRDMHRHAAEFAKQYFKIDPISCLSTDLTTIVTHDAPSIFHVTYNELHYQTARQIFNYRFAQWSKQRLLLTRKLDFARTASS